MGVSVDDLSLDAFRDQLSQFLPPGDTESRNWLRDRLLYERGDFADAGLFSRLGQRLAQVDLEFHTQGNYLFYLAVAPRFFGPIVQQLGTAGLAQQQDRHWRRVVIEKPFGQDLESAKALNRSIRTVLQENQIYRIDHYLGKETVQNIMVFRFDNAIFEPIWNRRYIDHVQITNAETVGVERRGAYFVSVPYRAECEPA
jgi:glucose-6-phosphate 1-dehydrogenase